MRVRDWCCSKLRSGDGCATARLAGFAEAEFAIGFDGGAGAGSGRACGAGAIGSVRACGCTAAATGAGTAAGTLTRFEK